MGLPCMLILLIRCRYVAALKHLTMLTALTKLCVRVFKVRPAWEHALCLACLCCGLPEFGLLAIRLHVIPPQADHEVV